MKFVEKISNISNVRTTNYLTNVALCEIFTQCAKGDCTHTTQYSTNIWAIEWMDTNNKLVKEQSRAAQLFSNNGLVSVFYTHNRTICKKHAYIVRSSVHLKIAVKWAMDKEGTAEMLVQMCIFLCSTHTKKLQKLYTSFQCHALRLTHCCSFHSPTPYNNVMYLASECSWYIWLQ